MGEQVQIVICGTQEPQSARLEALLSSWAEEACVCLCMKKQGADYLSARCCADCNLLFVDSEGMFCDAVAQIQKMRESCPKMGVILLSDNPKFVIEAYRCHPDGLIRKPLTYQKLCDVMGRCFLYWQAGIRWMDLPVNHRRLRIPLCRLHYMEAAGRNTILFHANGQILVNCSLGETEKQLITPPFVRCQKSFIVHLGAVCELVGGELVMKDNRVISIARPQIRHIQRLLDDYRKARRREQE